MRKRTTMRGRRHCRKATLMTSLALLCVLGCHVAARAQNSPTGPAGGDLSGTYPNPTLAADRVRKTGDTVTGSLDVRISNTGGIVSPFSISSPGNPLLNRGVAMTFNIPGGGSATMLGGQVTSAWGGSSQTYMAFSAYNGTAMAEVFRLDGRGYVGVGTANPTAKLHVMSGTDSATTMLSLDTGTHGGTAMVVGGTANNESTFDLSVYRAGAYASRFGVNSAGNVYIQPGTGGVGIGTTTPGAAYKLDVAGSVNASGLCLGGDCKTAWSQLGGGGTSGGTFFNTVDGADMSAMDSSATAQNVGGSISFVGKYDTAGDYAGFARILGIKENATSGNYGGALVFQARANGGNQTEYMRVTSTGNVGVGTNAPGSKLFVGSGAPAGQTLAGINVALGGNSYVSASNGTVNTFIGSDTSSYGIVGTLTNHPLGLRSNNTLAVTIQPNGSVGIGTPTPGASYKLDVNGNTNVTGTLNATGAITGATVNATYQDVAEWVPSIQNLTSGTVVVLDSDHTNHVLASSKSYDTKVAGVVSAQPGISLGQGGDGKLLVATTGRVRVKVDATRAPIKVGDLLVTSDVEGVAMKSIPVDLGGTQIHRPGTIIGKALEPLDKGTGEILVLLSLQ